MTFWYFLLILQTYSYCAKTMGIFLTLFYTGGSSGLPLELYLAWCLSGRSDGAQISWLCFFLHLLCPIEASLMQPLLRVQFYQIRLMKSCGQLTTSLFFSTGLLNNPLTHRKSFIFTKIWNSPKSQVYFIVQKSIIPTSRLSYEILCIHVAQRKSGG